MEWSTVDEIALSLGVRPRTLKAWRQRQIPHKYRLPILKEAARRGIEASDDDLPRGKSERSAA
jgi:hypothetical protein